MATLKIGWCKIGEAEGAKALADLLMFNQTLSTVDLRGNILVRCDAHPELYACKPTPWRAASQSLGDDRKCVEAWGGGCGLCWIPHLVACVHAVRNQQHASRPASTSLFAGKQGNLKPERSQNPRIMDRTRH